MSVESPIRPEVTEQQDFESRIPGLEITNQDAELLSSLGRVSLVLGRAQSDNAPVSGDPKAINEYLEVATELDRESLVQTIHDLIHEGPANEVRAKIVPGKDGSSLVLTSEGIQQLQQEIELIKVEDS